MEPECSRYQAMIPQYLLDDLSAAERQALKAHLAACPCCRSEQESYSRTLQAIQSTGNEPVPRHFFVYPQERKLNLWEFFRLVKPAWQLAAAAIALLLVLAGAGSVMSSSGNNIDVAALKKEILKTAEEQNANARAIWLKDIQAEIARSAADLTKQQKQELTATLIRLDSALAGRLAASENRLQNDARIMAANLYRNIAQERTKERIRDLNYINLRLDSIELKNAHETRQTDAILSTLLQVSELRSN